MADRPPHSGTPRWVEVFGINVIFLVVAMMIIGGEQGPGYRVPSEGGLG